MVDVGGPSQSYRSKGDELARVKGGRLGAKPGTDRIAYPETFWKGAVYSFDDDDVLLYHMNTTGGSRSVCGVSVIPYCIELSVIGLMALKLGQRAADNCGFHARIISIGKPHAL
jgi:hypothetical protein